MGETATTTPSSSRELVAAYRGTQVDELRTRESGVRTDRPDTVHRMRVASRGLRRSLATFAPLFVGPLADHLRDELLWLAP